jgi:hypothetical protein
VVAVAPALRVRLPRVLRDLSVPRPALRMQEAKTCRLGFAEGRLRLIWWSRTPDQLATLAMCPVVAVAPALRVRLPRVLRDLSVFRPALRMQEAKTCRLGFAESRLRLIWWSRTPDESATLAMCPVVAAASAGWVPGCGGFTSAAVERSQVALAYPAFPARRGTGAGRDHRTFAVIATSSRVCTDQIRQTTTLREDPTTGFDCRRPQRRSKDQQRRPIAVQTA